jgi:tetratricopeptide (TPR) repeat protein
MRDRGSTAQSAGLRGLLLIIVFLVLGPQPSPLPVAQDFLRAQNATAKEDYATAARALADAAARLPYDGSVVYRAGLADISAQKYESAIERIQAAAALDGWTPARRIALGDAFLGSGDRPQALEQWELALQNLPADDNLLVRLANNYEAEGRYPEAVDALSQLAQVRANDPAVYYRLALLTAVTSPAEALARLARAESLAPDLAPKTSAIAKAIQTGQASGDEAYTFGQVGFALIQLNEWGLAELALTHAVNVNPDYADAHAYLGLAQDRQGKDGLQAYEAALRLAPESPLVNFLIGLHWRHSGDAATALTYLKKAQSLDAQNAAIAAELGQTYAVLGSFADAEFWFSQAVNLAPQSADFWLLLARFCVDNEFHVADPGLPAARKAVSLAPENAQAADTLGYALVLTGDLANGEKTLVRAAALDPNQPSTFYHLGWLYARQGRTPEAQAAFNRTLVLDPQGQYGGLALQALARLTP